MRILRYLEKAWIVAALSSFGVAIYNLVISRIFDSHVYFPMICGGFCLLLWFNVRGQRKFRDKIFGENQEKRENSGK
jgi:hypothetical protein